MGFTRIEIRDETYEALAALRTKTFESQKGAAPLDISLSDVIDTVLEIAAETEGILEAEVLEAIVITAELES